MASIKKILARPEGETELTNATAYYKDPTHKGKALNATSINRPDRRYIYLKPFSLATDVYFPFSIASAAYTKYATALGAHIHSGSTSGTGAITDAQKMPRVVGARPAKIVVVVSSKTGTYIQAKATKAKYLKYNTTTVTLPFGKSTANESEGEAFIALAPGVKSAAGVTDSKLRVYVQSERFAQSLL